MFPFDAAPNPKPGHPPWRGGEPAVTCAATPASWGTVRRRRRRRRVACLLGIALVLTPGALRADEKDHRREIRKAVEAGEVVPLRDLLERIREEFQGRVIKAELERESRGGRKHWVYEIRVLTSEGNVLKLEYDAETMELIRARGRREPGRHREDDD